MLKIIRPFILIVSSAASEKEDLLNVLASEGCLVSGFAGTDEAIRFLKCTFIIPDLIISESGKNFADELLSDQRLMSIPLIHIHKPLDIKGILSTVVQLTCKA